MLFRYLKSRIAKQQEQITTHQNQIFTIKSIPNLSSIDKKLLINNYEGLITNYKNHIVAQEKIMKDEDFLSINKSINNYSDLKEVHSYLIYDIFVELKKFKDLKIPIKGYDKHIESLENAYDTISPYLHTPTKYTFPKTPYRQVKTLYERLRQYDYSKYETLRIIDTLSPLDTDRKGKPTNSKEPITKMIDPVDGKTYHVSTCHFVQEIL